jgi:hypothetical protein
VYLLFDFSGLLTYFGCVSPGLHSEEHIHVELKYLLRAQRHFRRERGFFIQRIGKRYPGARPEPQRLCSRSTQLVNHFGYDEGPRMVGLHSDFTALGCH